MDELLAIVGGSWQPLLLYPGLLTTLLVTVLMGAFWRRADAIRHPIVGTRPLTILAAACPLLVSAMLPAPRSFWAYPIDLFLALVLLEVPHWLRLTERLQRAGTQATAAAEAAALLNVYLLLALGLAALGQAAGSLLLPELRARPGVLRWAGLITWATAMPPLLGLGPWSTVRDGLDDLRRVVHVGLLVAIALPDGDQVGYIGVAAGAITAFGTLTLLHYLWHGDTQRWERIQPLLALLLLVILLGMGTNAWVARMR
jgi:hypothetical protein